MEIQEILGEKKENKQNINYCIPVLFLNTHEENLKTNHDYKRQYSFLAQSKSWPIIHKNHSIFLILYYS